MLPSRKVNKKSKDEEALEHALMDGTQLSGFVTAKENWPPRDCGHCRWFIESECSHPVVRIDPELAERRAPNGNIRVDADDCCNAFQNRKQETGKEKV
jgi:hypothetical protein